MIEEERGKEGKRIEKREKEKRKMGEKQNVGETMNNKIKKTMNL